MTLTDQPPAPLADLIEPTWWTGTPAVDPESFRIDCADYRMDATDLREGSELRERIRRTYEDVGLVWMVDTGLTDLDEMRAFAKVVLEREMAYEGGANPRDRIKPNVYEVGAPLGAWLHYHHEMAYVSKSTKVISFLCTDALPGRGATYVSDSIAATDALLATEFGQKLRALGICYHRNLTDRDHFVDRVPYGVYNHWQRSFDTDDPGLAEQRAHERGLVTEWGEHGLLKTRYYCSAFEYFPPLDRNVLYASVADHGMWFDTWPLVQHLPYDERPLNLTFGDDTPLSRSELEQWVALYDRLGTPIDWREGDIGIICNYRFAHGRPGIHLADGEARQLGVLLGEQYDRVGELPGKW